MTHKLRDPFEGHSNVKEFHSVSSINNRMKKNNPVKLSFEKLNVHVYHGNKVKFNLPIGW